MHWDFDSLETPQNRKKVIYFSGQCELGSHLGRQFHRTVSLIFISRFQIGLLCKKRRDGQGFPRAGRAALKVFLRAEPIEN